MIKKIIIAIVLLCTMPIVILLDVFGSINKTLRIISLMFSGKSFVDSVCTISEQKIESTKDAINTVEKFLGRDK
ncbi:MAG: hypothetical protein WC516_04680 [Patescibacteria group bacterium]|jgi:hypothetical protein